MSSPLDALYQAAVLDHARKPRNRYRPDDFTVAMEGVNPGCGDELTLFLGMEEGVLRPVAFLGEGCAISQASASLMTGLVRGRTPEEARGLSAAFKAMIRGEEPDPALGDARVLAGVSRLHARVKCADLAWVTLEHALGELLEAQAGSPASSSSSSSTG